MRNVTELLNIFHRLSDSNRFAVLVYARMKIALQFNQTPAHERRRAIRVRYPSVHWIGG